MQALRPYLVSACVRVKCVLQSPVQLFAVEFQGPIFFSFYVSCLYGANSFLRARVCS